MGNLVSSEWLANSVVHAFILAGQPFLPTLSRPSIPYHRNSWFYQSFGCGDRHAGAERDPLVLGSYLFDALCVLCHRNTALLVASVLMLNGFLLPSHYCRSCYFPWFCFDPLDCFVAVGAFCARALARFLALAAELLAYWVHSGFGSLALAGALTVFLLAIAAMLRRLSLQGPLQFGIVLQTYIGRWCVRRGAGGIEADCGVYPLAIPRTFYSLPELRIVCSTS